MLYELKNIRKASGLSQTDAANEFDIPLGTYRNWEQCLYMPRDNAMLKRIADRFNVSMEALFGYDLVEPGDFSDLPENKDSAFVHVPVYGEIAAGEPIYMAKIEKHEQVPKEIMKNHPRAYMLRVEGESMNNVLPNRVYALVDPDRKDPIIDDLAYAVQVNGHSATIKRVRKLANGFELIPDSKDPTFKPVVFDYGDENTDEISVLGEVVWYSVPFGFEI